MMRSQCSGLVLVALVSCGSWLWGCDDEAEVLQGGLDSSSGGEQPAPGGAARSGGGAGAMGQLGAASSCVPSDCPQVVALGRAAEGCCQNDGACGGLVLLNGRSLCAPPNVDDVVVGAGSTLMQLRAETVQADPVCGERNILGTPLPGCCDQTGVCGVSTAPLAVGSAGAIPGLDLPVTCVSPEEAAQLGGGMAALGSTVAQLCGGAASAPDAGADPEPPVELTSDAGPSDAGG